MWHYSSICVTWLIRMCDMTLDQDDDPAWERFTHMCHVTHSYAWHDTFMCVTWFIHMCYMTNSHVWHDSRQGQRSYKYSIALIHMSDRCMYTSFKCVTHTWIDIYTVCCMCLWVYTHACICTCIYIYKYINAWMRINICTYMYMYISKYACLRIFMYLYMYSYACVCICMNKYTCIYASVYIYIYICIHIYVTILPEIQTLTPWSLKQHRTLLRFCLNCLQTKTASSSWSPTTRPTPSPQTRLPDLFPISQPQIRQDRLLHIPVYYSWIWTLSRHTSSTTSVLLCKVYVLFYVHAHEAFCLSLARKRVLWLVGKLDS